LKGRDVENKNVKDAVEEKKSSSEGGQEKKHEGGRTIWTRDHLVLRKKLGRKMRKLKRCALGVEEYDRIDWRG